MLGVWGGVTTDGGGCQTDLFSLPGGPLQHVVLVLLELIDLLLLLLKLLHLCLVLSLQQGPLHLQLHVIHIHTHIHESHFSVSLICSHNQITEREGERESKGGGGDRE